MTKIKVTREQVFKTVCKVLADRYALDVTKLSNDTNIRTDLDADSIDQLEIALELEDYFDIDVKEEVLSNICTIGDIIDYVVKHQETD